MRFGGLFLVPLTSGARSPGFCRRYFFSCKTAKSMGKPAACGYLSALESNTKQNFQCGGLCRERGSCSAARIQAGGHPTWSSSGHA